VTTEIRPFVEGDVDAVAGLLTRRHAAHIRVEPLLVPGDAARWIHAALAGDGVSGVIALRRGAPAGYLIGRVRANDVWGRHVMIDRAGHAASDPELMRDLYAAAAEPWVEQGAVLHLAQVPATDEILDPWYRLGFGQMQLEAVRPAGGSPVGPLPGIVIRPAVPDDLDQLVRVHAPLIWEHQTRSPTFTGLSVPTAEELRPSWEEIVGSQEEELTVADRAGRIVGHTLVHPLEPAFGMPERGARLATAAVVEDVRGSGVGVALAERAFERCRARGHAVVVTDWRVPNLIASRFWPARGFRPAFHRLHRVLRIG
jgi:GNAT superfamily N-acetyltransferase